MYVPCLLLPGSPLRRREHPSPSFIYAQVWPLPGSAYSPKRIESTVSVTFPVHRSADRAGKRLVGIESQRCGLLIRDALLRLQRCLQRQRFAVAFIGPLAADVPDQDHFTVHSAIGFAKFDRALEGLGRRAAVLGSLAPHATVVAVVAVRRVLDRPDRCGPMAGRLSPSQYSFFKVTSP